MASIRLVRMRLDGKGVSEGQDYKGKVTWNSRLIDAFWGEEP